jgi:glutamyl/glutaminyl-tRNA synthetase
MDELETKIKELETQLQERDAKIAEMQEHAKEKNYQFKLLRDMTEREKELLSETELELKRQQDAIYEEQQKFRAEQESFRTKQKEETVNKLVEKYSKGNQELADKIRITLGQFKDVDTAFTETEIAPFVENATRIVLPEINESVRDAHNQSFATPAPQEGTSFADTQEGKELSNKLFAGIGPEAGNQ